MFPRVARPPTSFHGQWEHQTNDSCFSTLQKARRTVLVHCTECADCRCRLTNGQRVARSQRLGFTVNLVAACAHLFVNESYQIELRDEVGDRVGVAIQVGVNRHAMSRLRSHEGTHVKECSGGRDGEQQPIAPCVARE